MPLGLELDSPGFQLIRYAGIWSRIWLMLVTMSIMSAVGRSGRQWSRVLAWLLSNRWACVPGRYDSKLQSSVDPLSVQPSIRPLRGCRPYRRCDLDAVDQLSQPGLLNPAQRCAAQPQRVVLLEDRLANVWSNNALTSFSRASAIYR